MLGCMNAQSRDASLRSISTATLRPRDPSYSVIGFDKANRRFTFEDAFFWVVTAGRDIV